MILRVWRYDKAWVKLAHHPPPPHTSLCPRVWHTHLPASLPCSLVHLPALLEECRVSAMRQQPSNELRWERLGSVVGTLLPSLLSLPGNLRCLREGPPAACCMNEHQTKTLTNRWVTRVNVGFSLDYYFSLPHHFFFMAGTLLYIGLKKKKGHRETKQCGNFSRFLFSSSKSFYQY